MKTGTAHDTLASQRKLVAARWLETSDISAWRPKAYKMDIGAEP